MRKRDEGNELFIPRRLVTSSTGFGDGDDKAATMRALVETKKDPTSSRWALCQSRDLPQTELLLIQWTQIRTAPWTVGPIHSVRHPIRRKKTRETDQYCHVRSSSEIRLPLSMTHLHLISKNTLPRTIDGRSRGKSDRRLKNISHLRGIQQFSLFENLHTMANMLHPGRVAVIDGLELLSAIPSFIQTG